jgi:hypothetical protein
LAAVWLEKDVVPRFNRPEFVELVAAGEADPEFVLDKMG